MGDSGVLLGCQYSHTLTLPHPNSNRPCDPGGRRQPQSACHIRHQPHNSARAGPQQPRCAGDEPRACATRLQVCVCVALCFGRRAGTDGFGVGSQYVFVLACLCFCKSKRGGFPRAHFHTSPSTTHVLHSTCTTANNRTTGMSRCCCQRATERTSVWPQPTRSRLSAFPLCARQQTCSRCVRGLVWFWRQWDD